MTDTPRRRGPLSFDHIRQWSVEDRETGCWNWTRAAHRNGYGVLRDGNRTRRAHRAAYELFHKVAVPRGLDVCHRCDNRKCVNPDHLFTGSRLVNMQDCAAKGRIRLPMLAGEALPQAKLDAQKAREIRASSASSRALALQYGVSRRTITFIKQGKTWRRA